MGWTAVENGELLTLAAEQFDVFVTVDRNLSFQQNLDALPIAVVALQAETNRLADLRPLARSLVAAIESVPSGGVKLISAGCPANAIQSSASQSTRASNFLLALSD